MANYDEEYVQQSTAQPGRPLPTVNGWLVLVLLGLVGVLLFQLGRNIRAPLHDPNAQPREISPRGDLADDEKSTIAIFREASPSVVHITNLTIGRDAVKLNILEIPQGTGTGFIWDTDGHIVTNYHVIQNASAARVTLADNTTWEARFVGAARDKDLAVVKIDAPRSRLPPIKVGTSADLQVGQKVFAIGNPFGMDQTLTTGVISGLGREILSVTERPIQDVIQTDAAINPGNSGGPLMDSAGRLIGVNTAIYSPSGTYAGIGFAVPVDIVNRIVPLLIRDGKIVPVGMGIRILPDYIAAKRGLRGVVVLEVIEGSSAAKAGIQPTLRDTSGRFVLGDQIIGINDQVVKTSTDLFRALDGLQAGEQVMVRILRDDQEISLPVMLQSLTSNSP